MNALNFQEALYLDVLKLRDDVEKSLDNWNGVSSFRLSQTPYPDLTLADMYSLLACCDWYDAHGDLYGLRHFSPAVKAVLRQYGAAI